MRLSDGVEWGVHCCTVLALSGDRPLPATRLAEFHGVPPAYLAKHLQSLAHAGVLESVPGRRGGYRLARPADDVTLLDVVDAIDGGERAFRCAEIRQRGPAAVAPECYSPTCAIAAAMWRAERAYRAQLGAVTIAEVVRGLAEDVTPEAAGKAAAWFQEVWA